jgi:hypothetical protein
MSQEENNPQDQKPLTTSERVEALLSKKEEGKKFKDTEGRIGGSAKERRALGMIMLGNLDELEKDAVTARQAVKKDKVYPMLNVPEQMEQGISSGAAFLKVKAREFMGTTPPDSVAARKAYVGFIEKFTDAIDDIVEHKKLIEKFQQVAKNMPWIIIEILDPVKFGLIVEQNKESEIEYDRLGKEAYQHYESREKIRQEIVNAGFAQWNLAPEDHPLRQQHKRISDLAEELTRKKASKDPDRITPLEEEVLDTIGFETKTISRDSSYFYGALTAFLFGNRFYNFLIKNTYKQPTISKAYEDAEKYNGITEEESKVYLDKNLPWIEERIASYENEINFLNTSPSKAELMAFYPETGKQPSIGFFRSNFGKMSGKQHYFYNDVLGDAPMLERYLKLYKDYLQEELTKKNSERADLIEKWKPTAPDWSWTGLKTNKKTGERKSEITANSGVPLSYIKRTGGLPVETEMIDTDEKVKDFFKNILGISRIEYGLSITDKEKQEHIRHFSGAMLDLHEILNWNLPQTIGWGNLGIKFASSGRGKAMAHYEAARVAINLTRGNGDGTVSHEYAHYLDNMFAKKLGSSGFLTDNVYKTLRYIQKTPVEKAVEALLDYIVNGRGITQERKVKKTFYAGDRDLSNYGWQAKSVIRDTIEATFEAAKNYYSQLKWAHYVDKKNNRQFLEAIVRHFGYKSFTFEFDTNTSLYYAQSTEMSSDYWSRPHELFARAFETYVYDKLAEKNRVNNYLVSGGYFEHTTGVYPQGEERKQLFVLYDNLMNAVKEQFELNNFEAFTNQRVDEFIDLDEDDSGEESGVMVDTETEEVVQVSGELHEKNAVKKIKKLIELL